uniref:vWA domain-containing protein n=1 Tax=Flavobacterium sp. TaxID=239 RepID=UPI00404B8CAA
MYALEEKIYLYGLILIPFLLLLFLVNQWWKRKKQREFGDLILVKKITPEASVFKPWLKITFFLFAFAALIIALVNPKMGSKMETVKREGIDIVFALDVSKSMLAEDVAPNRLDKSKQMVSQIINQLGSDRIGIVAYAGGAFPVLPITTDYAAAKMFLQNMTTDYISSQGTALDQAINLAASYFDKDSATNKLIIMITDGEDHSEGIESAIQIANDMKIKIITIGVGTEKGAPIPVKENGKVAYFIRDKNDEVVVSKLNSEMLTTIAKETEGGYIQGNSTKAVLEYVNKALDNIEKTEFETTQIADYKSQFQWFLGLAFLLLWADFFFLEQKTQWIQKLNLFNEKKNEK